ncbi:DUF2920 family protein [Salibacterium sp. K-3]
MAEEYKIKINGHPNIYNKWSSRELNVYFDEPNEGVNENTGILLLIAGFGANANANVYKKMRSELADNYNFVTVQCDYFGWEFMQSDILEESIANFNDMGLLQAIDNITSVIAVAEILKDNGLSYNAGNIIGYGHSHGAYLAYLCNAFAPFLFSTIVDNSSWLFPLYLKSNRLLNMNGNHKIFDYRAKSIIDDFDILHLPLLYEELNNTSSIYSFHGVNDNLISLSQKKEFIEKVPHSSIFEIDEAKIDNYVFYSTGHGLKADFIELFNFTFSRINKTSNNIKDINFNNQIIHTNKYKYDFDYSKKVPILKVDNN